MTRIYPEVTDRKEKGWSQQQLNFLRNHFRTLSIAALSEHIGKHPETISRQLKKEKLKRTKEEAAAVWRESLKNTLAKKPKKEKPVKEKVNRGAWMIGKLPANAGTPGEQRQRVSKTGDTIWYECIAPKNWIPVHRLVYEKAHGPLPKNYVIIFKDGNTLNPTLDNLTIITRGERMKQAKAINNKRTDQERILILRERKSRHYHEVIKPRREAASEAKRIEREVRRATREAEKIAKAFQKEAERAEREEEAAKIRKEARQKQAEQMREKARLKREVEKVQKPRLQKATTPIKQYKAPKAPETGKLPEITDYKDRVKKMSYNERIAHLNSQVAGKVAVWLDHKTVVYRDPDKL